MNDKDMKFNEIAEKIREADAILIGASNGLSITEGLHLFADNQAFEELFGDLKRKYGLQCILHGMGARWPSEVGILEPADPSLLRGVQGDSGDGRSEKGCGRERLFYSYIQRGVSF